MREGWLGHLNMRVVSLVAGVLAPVLLFVSTLSWWCRVEVVAPEALGRHARAAAASPAVQDELSRAIARAVATQDRRLTGTEPVLREAAGIVIGSRQFADLLDIAMQQVGKAVTSGRAEDASRLTDIEQQFVSVVEALDPALAARIPRSWDTQVVDLRSDGALARWLAGARSFARASWPLTGATAVVYLTCIAAAARRRDRALAVCGYGVALVGAAVLISRVAVGHEVERRGGSAGTRAAIRSAFDLTTGGWRAIGVAYLVIGVVTAVAAVRSPWVERLIGLAVSLLKLLARIPARGFARVLWGLGAVGCAAGLAAIATHVGPYVVLVLATSVAFAGFRVLAASLPSTSVVRAPAARWRSAFLVVVAATGCVLAGGLARNALVSSRDLAPSVTTLQCNGRADLCDRRVDEVTFAGTHNSMASVDDGFLFASQRTSLTGQLEGGIRAFLVDSKYGYATNAGVVWTDLRDEAREDMIADLGQATVESIERLRATLLTTSTTPELHLCHHLCELGAIRADVAFGAIRTYLESHLGEVLVLIIQDDTASVDTVAALDTAGLSRFAYTHDPGEPWPTLGSLVRNATPLIVFAENRGGQPAWFHRAFDHIQDTPYDTIDPATFSCTPNRGNDEAELFLLNNWVAASPPEQQDAAIVNAEGLLVERAHRCTQQRGRRVNIIAVNFWQTGDLLVAVERLNDESAPDNGS